MISSYCGPPNKDEMGNFVIYLCVTVFVES